MSNPVRVLIADDHLMVRVGLQAVLGYDPAFAVAAVAEDGVEAVDLFRQHRPDVALLDVRMPRLDGLGAVRRIKPEFPDARLLMLSTSGAAYEVADALAAGACGFVLKTAGLSELRDAVTAAIAGHTWLSEELRRSNAEVKHESLLSQRQREVLDLLASGLSNKEIARALGFTVDGAKAHLKSIYLKLGVTDRAEAIVAAMKLGLIRSG